MEKHVKQELSEDNKACRVAIIKKQIREIVIPYPATNLTLR